MRKFVFVIPVLLMLAACDSLQVVSDYDKNVDFSQYQSIKLYGWAENSDRILNRFDKERIENAVSLEFRKRGYTYVESKPDLVVSLYVVSENKTRKTATTTYVGGMGGYYGYGPGWGWGGGYASTTFDEYDYKVGTLVISVYDAHKKELIWEGLGQGSVDENPGNRDVNLNRAIRKILYKYPVKPKR